MASVLPLVVLASNITFFLIFMLVTPQEVVDFVFMVKLYVTQAVSLGTTLIHQVHLLLKLLNSLGEPLDGSGKSLHLPLQGIGEVFDF